MTRFVFTAATATTAIAALAVSLGWSASAYAQHAPHLGAGPGKGQPHASAPVQRGVQVPQRVQPPRAAFTPQPYRGAAPHQGAVVAQRQWQRGQQLPAQWRQPAHVAQDWQRRGLPQPARGQQWVRHGADHLLVSIATGVIAQLVLGR